jgi:hypothetical protein
MDAPAVFLQLTIERYCGNQTLKVTGFGAKLESLLTITA